MQDWYHLKGTHSSLVVGSDDGQLPRVVHWGARLADDTPLAHLARLTDLPSPNGSVMDTVPHLSLVPELGRGFHGEAGLMGHADRQRWGGQFTLMDVEELGDVALRFHCRDDIADLALVIEVAMDPSCDVVTLKARLTNLAAAPFDLDHLGLTLPLPARAAELISFHGRWIQEFLTQRQPWPMSKLVRENRRGKTSHDSFPALIAGGTGLGEQRGEAWGIHLAWSGNHRLVAERLVEGPRHIQAAEWLYPGELRLAEGESYATPKVYASWSGQGLNRLSQQFHRCLRGLMELDVTRKPRPVHLNTWEGFYFDHRPDELLDLVEHSARVGVERFILDDGWFGKRDDDHAGLGDWFVDERKHPGGLGYLIDAVKACGMEFGLWFEPEMVNPDSELFRAHPDWILQLEGYDQPLGRHQYVLDLARPEVFDYLFERIDHFLSTYDIAYIKWDMNRDLVQPGSGGVPSVHRQTQAFYRLVASLRAAHPEVEIETCASGGGRIDFEVLRHTQRVWLSDCIDPLERQRMQYAASLFLPPEILGSHISASPSHTTGRRHSLGYRLITAMFGHMGLELDVRGMTEAEQREVRGLVELYRQHRDLLHRGDFTRLDTADDALQAYGVVDEDRRRALFAATTLALPKQFLLPPLRLAGLDPQRQYRVGFWLPEGAIGPQREPNVLLDEEGGVFSGELLQTVGLQLPVLHPEAAMLIEVEGV
ncbi:alpha-galactosidase [Halomonas nitroreducens]|uniref:Alpha-galactosidase n=1 Tax=Halomonas nitroreducens TaxID=447425 RepID=A0A431V4G2_9GAMM|nr:alpha-galactosidase [Halomonas nitroreducens]RTR02972.1 alpha-galactosidase [Halomonas nitroreducens]